MNIYCMSKISVNVRILQLYE